MIKKYLSNRLTEIFLTIILVSFLTLAIGFAWTEPTSPPPGGNISAPINVGPVGQVKSGGLILNTGGANIGLIVARGSVGIGTTNPKAVLDVEGNIRIGGLSDQPSYALILGSGEADIYGPWEGPFSEPSSDTCNGNVVFPYTCPSREVRSCIDVISLVSVPRIPGVYPQVEIDGEVAGYFQRSVTCVLDSPIYKVRNDLGTLQFINFADQVNLVLTQAGNVGIGIVEPGAKLDVGGDVRISADLKAESNQWGSCTWRTVPRGAKEWACENGEFVTGIGYEPSEWTNAGDNHVYPEVDRLYCCKL